MSEGYKIAILGDSISEGVGSKKINYISSLSRNLNKNYQIKNFAYTGTTIKYAIQKIPELLAYNPDVVIVFYGNVDAILRPKTDGKLNLYHILPKRYRGNGMLDPRPIYSRNLYKSILEHADSLFRYNFKKLLIMMYGVYSWVGIEEFTENYQQLIDAINAEHRRIILVSTVTIDDYYFPNSTAQFIKYNSVIQQLARENNKLYLDLYSFLNEFDKDEIYGADHFHPNANGYEIIGKKLAEWAIVSDGR